MDIVTVLEVLGVVALLCVIIRGVR